MNERVKVRERWVCVCVCLRVPTVEGFDVAAAVGGDAVGRGGGGGGARRSPWLVGVLGRRRLCRDCRDRPLAVAAAPADPGLTLNRAPRLAPARRLRRLLLGKTLLFAELCPPVLEPHLHNNNNNTQTQLISNPLLVFIIEKSTVHVAKKKIII